MKKNNLLILAVAALGFAACANDETTAVNEKLAESNAISFRANVGGNMRTYADVTTANLTSFYAEAFNHSDNSAYFAKETFTKDGDNYRSSTKHYWPSTGNLDFIAFYPDVDAQFTHPTWNTFTLSPADVVNTHNDYVVATTINQTKAGSSTGVPLKFKHLGAQIIVKVYNSKGTTAGNVKATVSGWRIGYVSKSGEYTLSTSTSTTIDDPIPAPTIASGSQKDGDVPNSYSQAVSPTVINGEDYDTSGEAEQIGTPIIIVPQNVISFNASSDYATGGYLPGAFIAVKLLIQDQANHTLADATADGIWAAWPITNDWVAGNKYIYTIDLSQGGYKEKDTEGVDVKPWLDGAEIFFSNVAVTPWVETAGTSPFPNPAP